MNARNIPWRRWIPWMVAGLVVLLVVVLVLPAIQQAREAARRSQSKNNLRQFGIAFQNYHETYRVLPPGGVFGADGTAYHGWGSAVWPYMEASPYPSMINYDVPWDDARNHYLFKRYSPWGYSSPKIPLNYSAEGFVPSHYIGNQNLLHRNSAVTYSQMENGTSQTWLITEQFQDWWPFGAPYNWTALEWPRPGADSEYGWSGEGAHVVMADEAVKYFAAKTDPSIIQTLRDAPPVPFTEKTRKPSNPYRFESLPWKWRSLKLKNKTDDTYWDVMITPSGEFDTACVVFDNGNMGVELVIDDVVYLLEEFPEITSMSVDLTLDDELLDVLLQNKKLEYLTMDKIVLSTEGIERLKEFPQLKFVSGLTDDEIREQIQKTLPELRLRNKRIWEW